MKLTKTSTQAALAMTFLASQSGKGLVQARQVAEHLGIPTDSALKVLQTLTRQGLIQSQLGRSGGYQFVGDADTVTLLDIVEAIDGPISTQVPIEAARQRLVSSVEQLRRVYSYATERVRAELGLATLASLSPESPVYVRENEPLAITAEALAA